MNTLAAFGSNTRPRRSEARLALESARDDAHGAAPGRPFVQNLKNLFPIGQNTMKGKR